MTQRAVGVNVKIFWKPFYAIQIETETQSNFHNVLYQHTPRNLLFNPLQDPQESQDRNFGDGSLMAKMMGIFANNLNKNTIHKVFLDLTGALRQVIVPTGTL